MNIISIIIVAIVLSIDSFTISIVDGCTFKNISIKKYFEMAFIVAGFHVILFSLGWFIGYKFGSYFIEIGHWIAFALLLIIGLKMIYEGIKKRNTVNESSLTMPIIISQAFATSIDAFAIGISFAFLNIVPIFPLLIIGSVTLLFTILGLYIGKYYCKILFEKFDIIGGFILIGIGIKIIIGYIYF
ncbi:MAG: manganese efflux pump [Candidatus Marinimicrobia bacterium]|nr:manganese efflux pump [Candidatus Neomarinimicrobiota bacterium]